MSYSENMQNGVKGKTCKSCMELKVEITRNGFKPYCTFKKHKFKERKEVRWESDKDINGTYCELYKKL